MTGAPDDPGAPDVEYLAAGNVAAEVVRIGDTVRKPATPATPSVDAVLRYLADVGFEGAPRSFGLDERGRHVLEWVPGQMADTMGPRSPRDLRRVGRLVRDLHDALAEFVPPADATWNVVVPPDREDLVCHHDLAPWNLVVGDDRWVFIDWDGAGPGSRLWDLAYTAQSFTPLVPGGDPAVDGPRLRALVDAYGLDDADRAAFPDLVEAHTRGMADLLLRGSETGELPWARLYDEGHADFWYPAADYVRAHRDRWLAALA